MTVEDVTPPLWRWAELCEALELTAVDGPDVTGISIDSRTTRPGDLFLALSGDPGPRFNPSQRSERDGHDFIDAALANGAVGVVAHDGRPREAAQLQVEDTLDALWALGQAARARYTGPVVAITGSSGKTTTKGFLATALDAFSTRGSLNNHLGVPLSLTLTPRTAAAAVYELGTNHPGEIGPLSQLVQPDVAVVLNVHPAHRGHFASMAALAREKLSIHQGLGPDGHLVVEEGVDDAALPDGVHVSRFGRGATARVRLVELEDRRARYRVSGREVTAHVPGGGLHRAMNLAGVLCVLDCLGADIGPACRLTDALIPPGRGQALTVAGVTILDDSYNANPASMRAALAELQTRPEARRYALLGEMGELGDEGPALHRELGGHAAGLTGVFAVGPGMEPLVRALPEAQCLDWRPEADEALLERLVAVLAPGDALLVKGSNRVFWSRGFVQRLVERLQAGAAAKKCPAS